MSELSEAALIEAIEAAIVEPVRTISAVLHRAGHRAWVVGGSVRDLALGLIDDGAREVTSDWDLATSAEPKLVQKLFRQVIPTGIAHGTVTIVLNRQSFEVTTLRGERGHTDGRRPDEVFFVDDINADLARRDFTVNAIAYDIERRSLHDPFGGLSDLVGRRLKAVGDPRARFAEDGLRVLRCARFAATLDFDLDEQTKKAILPSLASFQKVAQERVQQEWLKALSSRSPGRFFEVVFEQGMLEITAPVLFAEKDSCFSPLDTARRLNLIPADPLRRLAFLIVAGTATQSDAQKANETAHQSAQLLSRRLKLSRQQQEVIARLTSHHRPPDELSSSSPAFMLRRYVAQIGRDQVDSVLAFQSACHRSPPGDVATRTALESLHERLLVQSRSDDALTVGELEVSGQDLLALGIPKGPRVGQLLKLLLERVLEDPSLNSKEQLLRLARAEA